MKPANMQQVDDNQYNLPTTTPPQKTIFKKITNNLVLRKKSAH
jgi:hypothetical protein